MSTEPQAVRVTALQVFTGSFAAYGFAKVRFPGRDVIFVVLLAGLMVPDQVLIVPRFVIMREFGGFDTYQGLIIPLIFSSFGVFLLRQFFLCIPRDFPIMGTCVRFDGRHAGMLGPKPQNGGYGSAQRRGHVELFDDGGPHRLRVLAVAQRLPDRAAAEMGQDVVSGDGLGVARTKLTVHPPPEVL